MKFLLSGSARRTYLQPIEIGDMKPSMTHDMNQLGQPIGFTVANWKSPPLPSRVPMSGHYCRLEPLDPNVHAASLHAANALDAVGKNWTYLAYGPFETLESYLAWIDRT